MKNKNIFVIGLLLLSVTLPACNPTAPTTAPTNTLTATIHPTEAPTELVVNFPTGKFVKSNSPSHGLIFNNDGNFSVFDGSQTIANGTYRVEGDTYIETSNDQNCPVPMSFITCSMEQTLPSIMLVIRRMIRVTGGGLTSIM